MIERILRLWCRFAHTDLYRPVSGVYRCAQCLRTYRVAWEPER